MEDGAKPKPAYGDFIVVRATQVRSFASVLAQQMQDTVEALIERDRIKKNARLKLAWRIEEA